MPLPSDLSLPYLPLDEPGFSATAFEQFANARLAHPWLARCVFGYVITSFTAIRELMAYEDNMRMPAADMVALMGAAGTPWGEFLVHTIQGQNGDEHRRLRAVLSRAFTPRQANLHRPLMRQVIFSLLDEWVPRGAFDFEEFASNFPITVMCKIIGASPEVIPSLKSSLEKLGLGGSMDAAFLPALQEGFLVLDRFVKALVAERRGGPRHAGDPDLLELLLQANESGGLNDDELYNLLVFLFAAGFDTSKNVLTLTMFLLLDRPDDYARCAVDLDFCRAAVEETLRYHGIASLPRIVKEDIVLRGVTLPAGTMLMLPWSVVGRDAAAIEDADRFLPERGKASSHMGFGLGPHICLGQFVARAQIVEGLHLIAQRIKNPRLNGPVGMRPFAGAWGLRGLPIAFDPGL